MTKPRLAVLIVTLHLGCAGSSGRAPVEQPVVKATDLPAHSYRIDRRPSALLADDAGFARFAAELRRDLETDLARLEIDDTSVVDRAESTLALIAYLDGRLDDAAVLTARVRARQVKPALKLTTLLTLSALVDARRAGGALGPAFRTSPASAPST